MVASAEDDTAQRFGRSVIGLLNSQLGGLQIRSRGFQRQGMIAQHAETLGMMADLRRQMRENAAKYGIEPPPEALEPEDAPKPQASHTAAAAMLARHNFATVDSFLGDTTAGALRSEVLQMQADGYLKPGQIEGGRAASIRGDYVGYLDEDATRAYPGFGACLKAQDAFVGLLSRTVPELKGVGLSRQRAMVANYPSAGARYARHVDNPDQNGRKLTVILYLNPGWREQHGGNLKIYTNRSVANDSALDLGPEPEPCQLQEEQASGENEVTVVVPVMDRLLVFWSDTRCPHEVTAVADGCGPRLAVTTWYFDNKELSNMTDRELHLACAVREWADANLQWDPSLRNAEEEIEHRDRIYAGQGLLQSYRAAVGDSLARWEDMVFSAGGLRGCEEKLAARSRFQQQVPGDDFKGDPETSQNIGAEWEIQTHAASLCMGL